MYRQRRPSNMPSYHNAHYQFMRQAKRAELMGLGEWIDDYMPRGYTTIEQWYCAAGRFRAALDLASDNVSIGGTI